MANTETSSGICNADFEDLKDDSRFKSFAKPLKFWSNEQNLIVFFIKIIMFKVPCFKNRNNDSFIMLRSLFITFISLPIFIFLAFLFIRLVITFSKETSFLFLYNIEHVFTTSLGFLEEHDRKISLLSLSAVSLIYFNLRTRFSNQWKYCADLYNRISFDRISNCDPRDILYQRVTLSIDLLQLDLYAHSSFKTVFNVALEKSITYCYSRQETKKKEILDKVKDERNIWVITHPADNAKDEISRIKSGRASTNQVKVYLSILQNDLDNLMTLDYQHRGY